MSLSSKIIKQLAHEHGFDVARICDARKEWQSGNNLKQFVANNYHGTMQWFETTLERRTHPNAMWDGAISAIMLGVNYAPDYNPLEKIAQKSNANISSYAQNNDYHDTIKKRLKALAGILHKQSNSEVKVFVDTAPLMEKPLAARAGMGWQGKHTNLVSREFGSYLFLGSILIATELEYDAAETNHCGNCTSCIDICPTGAIIAPYKIDARLCISYLTIEYDGVIPDELMAKMGNRIYGCDDCLAVCPWNKFATPTNDENFLPREDLKNTTLETMLLPDDAAFRDKFRKSPIKRIGFRKYLRNLLIAIGNSGNKKLAIYAKNYLNSDDDGIKASARFAVNQLEKQ
jgi:epoxyqueuosine reductase